ncbi:MAG TPA: hypothetical protein VGO71_03660 [Baekduia sp.]|nr:hypothetical protein [Baekduia sp.]
MDLTVLIPALVTGALSAGFGQHMAVRDRARARAKTPGAPAAGSAAVPFALGAIGLAFTAVVIVVWHKPVPLAASVLFVILLALGSFGLARARRYTDHADHAE